MRRGLERGAATTSAAGRARARERLAGRMRARVTQRVGWGAVGGANGRSAQTRRDARPAWKSHGLTSFDPERREGLSAALRRKRVARVLESIPRRARAAICLGQRYDDRGRFGDVARGRGTGSGARDGARLRRVPLRRRAGFGLVAPRAPSKRARHDAGAARARRAHEVAELSFGKDRRERIAGVRSAGRSTARAGRRAWTPSGWGCACMLVEAKAEPHAPLDDADAQARRSRRERDGRGGACRWSGGGSGAPRERSPQRRTLPRRVPPEDRARAHARSCHRHVALRRRRRAQRCARHGGRDIARGAIVRWLARSASPAPRPVPRRIHRDANPPT